jgi:peptidoglycan/LPS O-acetylase OafA/YrhL
MSTATTASPSGLGTTARGRSLLQGATAGAAVATLVNAGLWVGGRAADVSFLVSPPLGDPATQVGIVAVVLTTLLMFAVGSGLLALAARRSRRWVRAVLIAAALIAVVSAGAPLSVADETATGVLLAAMHLVTGAAFLVTASRVRAPWRVVQPDGSTR